MGLLFLVIGIVLVISGNVAKAYTKSGRPKAAVRVCLTIRGIGLILVGLRYLGIFHFGRL